MEQKQAMECWRGIWAGPNEIISNSSLCVAKTLLRCVPTSSTTLLAIDNDYQELSIAWLNLVCAFATIRHVHTFNVGSLSVQTLHHKAGRGLWPENNVQKSKVLSCTLHASLLVHLHSHTHTNRYAHIVLRVYEFWDYACRVWRLETNSFALTVANSCLCVCLYICVCLCVYQIKRMFQNAGKRRRWLMTLTVQNCDRNQRTPNTLILYVITNRGASYIFV